MSYFYKNKWWTAIVAILFVANIITLIFFWTAKAVPATALPQQRQENGNGPAAFIIHELQFSPEQQQQFDELRQEHQQQVRSIRDSIRMAKDNFFSLLNSNVNDSEIELAATKGEAFQQKLDVVTFEHFKKVKAICTPRQQQRFNEIIKQVLQQMTPQSPSNDRGKPGGPVPNGKMPPPPPDH